MKELLKILGLTKSTVTTLNVKGKSTYIGSLGPVGSADEMTIVGRGKGLRRLIIALHRNNTGTVYSRSGDNWIGTRFSGKARLARIIRQYYP